MSPESESEPDATTPLLGLRRGPSAGEFPTSVGWVMLLLVLNCAIDVWAGLVASAISIPLAAEAYAGALISLVLAVGLAQLRRWAWIATTGWSLGSILVGMMLAAGTRNWLYTPVFAAVNVVVLLRPAARKAFHERSVAGLTPGDAA